MWIYPLAFRALPKAVFVLLEVAIVHRLVTVAVELSMFGLQAENEPDHGSVSSIALQSGFVDPKFTCHSYVRGKVGW